MSTDSLVHSTELSNALLSTMRRAAALMSALASTKTGTLPGPTPSAGLPDEYAARTTPVPPVATMTSVRSSAINASTSGMDGSSITCDDAVGRPGVDGGFGQHPGGVGRALLGSRMGRHHNGIAGHQGTG